MKKAIIILSLLLLVGCKPGLKELLKDENLPRICKIQAVNCMNMEKYDSMCMEKCINALTLEDCKKYAENPIKDNNGREVLTFQMCLDKIK